MTFSTEVSSVVCALLELEESEELDSELDELELDSELDELLSVWLCVFSFTSSCVLSELPEEFPDVLSFDEQALNPARAKHADKTTDATSVFFFISIPFQKRFFALANCIRQNAILCK